MSSAEIGTTVQGPKFKVQSLFSKDECPTGAGLMKNDREADVGLWTLDIGR